MAGSLINRKSDILRAYYNEQDKVNSDYDYVYPITLMDNVKEEMASGARSLKTVLQAMENDNADKLLHKQDVIIGGDENNIVAYSGVDGKLNQLIRVDTVAATTADASTFKIPSEKAILAHDEDVIMPAISEAQKTVNDKVEDLKEEVDGVSARVADNRSAITELQAQSLAAQNAIGANQTAITDLTGRTDIVETTVNGWKTGVLNPAQKDSVYDLASRMAAVEKTALVPEDFGDGYYTKNIGISVNEDEPEKVLISNTRSHVDGANDVISSTTIASSNGTVKFKLNTVGAANSLDVTAAVTPADVAKKLDANTRIEPGVFPKIAYDEKGLVIGGNALTEDDIPSVGIAKVKGLQAAIDTKADGTAVTALADTVATKASKDELQGAVLTLTEQKLDVPTAVTPGTASKVTYDKNGLITGKEDLTVADLVGGIKLDDVDGLTDALDKKLESVDIAGVTGLQEELDKKLESVAVADVEGLQAELDKKLETITVTVDDVPELPTSKITGLDETITDFTEKFTKTNEDLLAKLNAPTTKLTAATASKVTFDENGLITGKEDLTVADLVGGIKTTDVDGFTTTIDTINTSIAGVTADLNKKVSAPETPLTPGTACKVTYDANGMITGSEALTETDIPDLTTAKITGLADKLAEVDTAIAAKATALTEAPTTLVGNKVTINAQGIVTKVENVDTPMDKVTGLNDAIGNLNASIDDLGANKLDTPTTKLTVLTGNKVTVDEHGLVTGLETVTPDPVTIADVEGLQAELDKKLETVTITADDVPELPMTKVTGLETALDGKLAAPETKLTTLTGSKVTVNEDGLVTNLEDTPAPEIAGVTGLTEALADKVDAATLHSLKIAIDTMVLAYANAIKSGLEAASVDVSHIDFSGITPLVPTDEQG